MTGSSPPHEYYPRNFAVHPPAHSPHYKTTALRSPGYPLISIDQTLTEVSGPLFSPDDVPAGDHDLLTNFSRGGLPVGERIIVHGHVLDENAIPVPGALVELWQANAAGRYQHKNDNHDAPLDPNFTGTGRTMTDEQGNYRFITIRPGAYPWRNHPNAWRPAHIHFSLVGHAFTTRLVTQMYFPGDPLLSLDPIYNSVPDEKARQRMISHFDINLTEPEHALGFRFDIVLRGRNATPRET